MILTLAHAYTDPLIIDAVGNCNQEQIRNAVNEAQNLIALSVNRDEQKENIVVMAFDQCFTLPRQYDNILHASIGEECATKSLTLRSLNYEHNPHGNHFSRGYGENVIPRGVKPVFRQPSFPRFHIFAVSEKREKETAYLVVQGLEGQHTEVFTGTLENATFQPGERLPITSGQVYRTNEVISPCDDPIALSNIIFTREEFTEVTALLKRDEKGFPYRGNGYIYIYAFEPQTQSIQLISYIHPYDTEAEFATYRITALKKGCCQKVYLQVTKKFIPAYHPDDVLFVQNIPALAAMIRSERARRANEIQLANYEINRSAALMESKERRLRKNEQRVVKPFWQRGLKAFR